LNVCQVPNFFFFFEKNWLEIHHHSLLPEYRQPVLPRIGDVALSVLVEVRQKEEAASKKVNPVLLFGPTSKVRIRVES